MSLRFLREINFKETRSFKTAIFAIFGAMNFVNLVKLSLQKVQKFMNINIHRLKMC